MFYVASAIFIAALGLFWLMRRDSYKHGSAEAENKAMKGVLDDVYTAKKARDAFAAAPDKRLRKKYTRKP